MKNVLRDAPGVPGPSPVREEAARPTGDEIDLLAYGRTWWRHRYVLIAVAVVVGITTYAINRAIAPTYQVEFRLMASEPRLNDEPERPIGIVTFRELVVSPSEAAALIQEFGLDRPPYNLTAAKFLDQNVNVEVIRDSPIIRVTVRLKNPDLLVKVARRYAERVVTTAQRLNVEGIDDMTRRIKAQRDAALDRLNGLSREVQDFRQHAQLEVLENDVDTILARRPDALELTVQIQGERARVRQMEAELARQPEVRSVPRATDDVPEPPARSDAGTAKDPEGLKIRSDLQNPYINPVYDALQRDLSRSRTQLASLEQQRRELADRIELDAPSAKKLNRLYDAQAGLDALTRDEDVARTAYVNAANKYEDARLQSTVRTPRLNILDAALPPDHPVAPRALRNTLAAMLVALTLAAIVVIAIDASERGTRDRR
jgi:uncharacterized protein involved in exopolysaccharide biosynthesis